MKDTLVNIVDTTTTGSWMDSVVKDGTITFDTIQGVDSLQNVVALSDQILTEEEQWLMAMNLMLKVVLILVVGFVIWRVILAYNKKNAKPKGGQYFKRKYSDKWKNR
jgi:heme/copper-type cytochrome/quinol oxidase subunit 2